MRLRLSFSVWGSLISRHAETKPLNGPPNGFRAANQRAECVDNDLLVEPILGTGVFRGMGNPWVDYDESESEQITKSQRGTKRTPGVGQAG